MKKMQLQVVRLLSYSVVFPDRHDKIDALLVSVPSNSAIEFISYNLHRKINQLKNQHDIDIWAPWLLKTREDVKNPIIYYAKQYNLGEYALIDKYAMLLLISRLLTHYNGKNDTLTTDDFSNLLLAYMLCCDERLELNRNLPNNSMTADDFVETYMPVCLKSDDIENLRDYRLLLIKCYMLMIEFPKYNLRFARYIDEFCKGKGLPNAQFYLDELFLTFLNLSSVDISNCLMEVDEKYTAVLHFFDNLSINPGTYNHDEDFLMMKERPILKTGPFRYNFMCMNMFLDKAYTGLLFDMKDVLVKRGVLDPLNGYMNLKSFLGEEFSERLLFYTLMRRCFGKHYLNYNGTELQNVFGEGMPDYYLRRGNRLYVFECKDVQIASRKKLSGDYETIKNAIFEKYVANTKGHGKGVTQLVNVIVNKIPEILNKLDKFEYVGIKYVFPIIIYFDNCFDVEGPNYLLNKEFRNIMSNYTISKDFIVKDVVMINIEQLMRLENFFADDRLKLASLINTYIEYKNQSELNQVFPFNKFIFQEAFKKGYMMKKTKWFDDIYRALVETVN